MKRLRSAAQGANFKNARQRLHLHREPWPAFAATLAGVAGVALATIFGPTELFVGGAAAYAAFRMLREGASPRKTFHQGMKLEEEATGGKSRERRKRAA